MMAQRSHLQLTIDILARGHWQLMVQRPNYKRVTNRPPNTPEHKSTGDCTNLRSKLVALGLRLRMPRQAMPTALSGAGLGHRPRCHDL